jgi:hypothetical protein
MKLYDVAVQSNKGMKAMRIPAPDLVNVLGQLSVVLDVIPDANDVAINIRVAADSEEDY